MLIHDPALTSALSLRHNTIRTVTLYSLVRRLAPFCMNAFNNAGGVIVDAVLGLWLAVGDRTV